MKLKLILSSGILAAFATVAIGVQAAAGTESPTEVNAPAAVAGTEKKMKPHSHATEKTGVPAQVQGQTADATVPAVDKKKQHFHPRDGK